MKTNLAYLETALDEAVCQEEQKPTLTDDQLNDASKSSTSFIAGFPIRDNTKRDAILETQRQGRRDRIANYRHSRDQIVSILNKLGIVALAVLPLEAWNRICTASGLFQLKPGATGRVYINSPLNKFSEGAEKVAKILALIFFLVPIIASFTTLNMVFDWPLYGIAIALVGGLTLSFLVIATLFVENRKGNKTKATIYLENLLTRARIWIFFRRPWKSVLKTLFSNEFDLNGRLRVQIVLPEPPAEVVDILRKAEHLQLRVAAEAGAIAFDQSIELLIQRQHDRDVEKELHEAKDRRRKLLEERLALRHDPIIYVVNGSVVAVIAQFGNFPIEKRVVDEIVHSSFLL